MFKRVYRLRKSERKFGVRNPYRNNRSVKIVKGDERRKRKPDKKTSTCHRYLRLCRKTRQSSRE